ncbi:hypothetical protein [Candidatus Enterococcus clewellii]|uniref:Phage protein n=1 Tax=Candidatus Enterococcus clewellii TaxID=1834193 RepID=A0A242K4J4_9ENTE|nr:hypothetical protein [Enterococcus sp. 9E7_DIV0242]OTP13720.1 hypothetical protein A5888_003199 [Enterococcus sp. 9E7_DIV0242]
MIITGKTKSGFNYEIQKERLENYELLEAIGESEENASAMTKVVKLLLGKEQTNKLKDHVRTESGVVPIEKLSEEITDIFQNQQITKNS